MSTRRGPGSSSPRAACEQRLPAEAQRLTSLDAFRGFAIASMVLVNNPGDWGHIYAPLAHAEWNGWTFTDLVFPFFLFAAGVALPISIWRRRAQGTPPG